MDDLVRAIEGSVKDIPDEAKVERLVFGTDDAAAIVQSISAFCTHLLGAGPEAVLFYSAHVGCSIGLRLADGREVVIKAYQPRWTAPFLEAVHLAQAHIRQTGFPCPAPVAGPAGIGHGWARVESYLPDPGPRPDRSATARRTSAASLARQIRLCEDLEGTDSLREHPQRTPSGHLYPEPHSPIFDFEGTVEGAAWIDDFARRAKELRGADDSPATVAHTDWSARNVRISGERLLAAYDWDSLASVPESTAVGQAGLTWGRSGEPEGDVVPEPHEIAAYIEDYETARGAPFRPRQLQAAYGAALWVAAYSARCEHSFIGRGSADGVVRSYLGLHGEELLSLAEGQA